VVPLKGIVFSTEALPVSYDELLNAVYLLAACSEITQDWHEGCRHDLALSFAGLARKHGLQLHQIVEIVRRICQVTNDPEVEDRLTAVRSTFARPLETVVGFSGLVKCLGEVKAKLIVSRIAANSSDKIQDTALPTITQTVSGIVNYDQFADKANFTEAKMGNAFAEWLADKAVYVFEKKQWMIWNGSCWEADQRSLITRLAYQFVTEAKEALVDIGKYSDLSKLLQFESINKLENITKFATTDRSVSASEFDTDPFLLAASDVWIDLTSGEVLAPTPTKLVSKRLSVDYDQAANCPTFLKFLDDIFENDQELIGFVQRAIGYSLTGATSEQCMFIMIGDGANGKSTFINVINQLMGLYGSTAASQTLIAHGGHSIGDDLVDLIGARLITVSETEEGQSLAEAKIKQMTGGDRLKGRPLYGTHIQFNIIGKLWLATNSLPQINNTDHGIWRRIKAIPFNRTFSAAEQDKALGDKLLRELPGILNWAIDGCLAWKEQELRTPQIVEDQVAEYKSAMDSISQFLQDECEQGSNHNYPAAKFYQVYRDWCGGSGRKPQSQTAFKRALEKLRGVYQQRSSSGLQWHGIQPCLAY
jgi:putative DNA primase/helicase